MSFNKVIIMGNLTKEPEMKYLPSGKPVTNFSVALNEKYKKGDEWIESVSYFDVVVFERQAETCNEYLSMGKQVLVEGKLQQRRWEAQDGTKRSKIEIVANRVVFLSSGEAKKQESSSKSSFDTVSDEDIPF